MPKDARITTVYLDKDNDDFLRCPTCPIKLSQFMNAKIREYRGLTEQEQKKEIGTEATIKMNENITREIKRFVTDLREKSFYPKRYNENDYDECLNGRCKIIKHKTGYDLTTTELKKLTEEELKKDKGVQTNL